MVRPVMFPWPIKGRIYFNNICWNTVKRIESASFRGVVGCGSDDGAAIFYFDFDDFFCIAIFFENKHFLDKTFCDLFFLI